MHVLRNYQRTACLATLQSLRDNPLLVAPTGAGKTTMGVYLAHALRSRRVVWLAHRTELIDQAVQRFRHHDIDAGVIQASREANPNADVQVASVQTLARREPVDAGVFIIDEAHRAAAESYRRVVPESATRIGLTATPFRNDGRGLGDMFGTIVQAATTQELVDGGTLMDPEVWIVSPPDMSGVTKRAGDYAVGESATRANTPERRADIVKQWKLRCDGVRTLAFGCNIEHSRAIAEAFVDAGVPAEHVDADTSDADRAAAIERLADGDILVLCNVGLFTEGFDLPLIGAVIDAAPTDSLGRHMQKIGRVMRTADGKDRAIVHDHAGNHLRLGRVTQPMTFSLDTGVVREPSEALGLTTCSECFRLFAGGTCPSCGAAKPEGEVPAIDGVATMTEMTDADREEDLFNRLCEEQTAYDHKDGWVLRQFKEETGEWPTVVGRLDEDEPMRFVNPDRADQDIKRAFYREMLMLALDKGWKVGAASVRYKEVFGKWPKGFVTEVKEELGVSEDKQEAWA